MRIPSWTVDEVIAEKPCPGYTRERLGELWAGRDRLTLLDILDLDIPDRDKVWFCCRDTPLREPWLERVLTRAVTDHARNYKIPAVRKWAKRWMSGEDRSADATCTHAWADTYSAAEAAWTAANTAAEAQWGLAYAAWAAAAIASHAAEWDAGWDAAEAVWDPDLAAAGAEREREQQLQDMREVIAEMCEGG